MAKNLHAQWPKNCRQTNLSYQSLYSYPFGTSLCPTAHAAEQEAPVQKNTNNVLGMLLQGDTLREQLRKETVLHADLAGAEGTGAFLQQQVLYVVVPHQWLRETGGCAV